MLKRTLTLLSLTIAVGTLLLAVGCGGSNSNPVAPVSSEQPSLTSRQANQLPTPSCLSIAKLRDGRLRFVLKATDPEGDQVFFKLAIWHNGQLVAEPNQKDNPSGWQVFSFGGAVYAVYTTPQSMPRGPYQWQVGATDDKHSNPGEWASSQVYSLNIF